MFSADLMSVKVNLRSAAILFDAYRNNDRLEDYSAPILAAARVVESMIAVLLVERGYGYDRGMIVAETEGRAAPYTRTPLVFFEQNIDNLGYPGQLRDFVNTIRVYRNVSAHMALVGYDEFLVFLEAYYFFSEWFEETSATISRLDPEARQEFRAIACRNRNEYIQWRIVDSLSQQLMLSSSEVDNAFGSDHKKDADLPMMMMEQVLDSVQNMQKGLARMEKKIDIMAEQLSVIYDKMTDYQALLERQVSLAASEEEIDRVIKAYSDEVSGRIVREIAAAGGDSEYTTEENNLRDSLGPVVWSRLDDSSKEFLITAKVTYSSYNRIRKAVDYSGVCLLVTKAVEVEMSNRFCRDYLAYLKKKYPGKSNYPQYPTVMLKYGKPMKPKDFTLGSVPYVLGVEVSDKLEAAEVQKIRDEIWDYCGSILMKGKNAAYITKTLEDISEQVDQVRKDYRNPSAHTNQLQKVNARECFDLVLDVEKVLKTIIEKLDY